MRKAGPFWRAGGWVLLLAPLLLAARCPVPGQSVFVSGEAADVRLAAIDPRGPAISLAAETDSAAEREVVEGDLFRVLSPGHLLNLNAFRGLQVIDIRDLTKPKIVGRLQVSGSPVELYRVGDIAFVLLNGWRGPGPLEASGVEFFEGGLVLSVDLGDPANPVLLDQAVVPGFIETSRLTRQGDRAALYVVATESARWNGITWESRTIVASFDAAGGRLAPADELDLGGFVSAVHATPELLLVARNADWSAGDTRSRVALIDISDPTGFLKPGDEVVAEGRIQSQFNMDHHGGILRIASGSRWGSASLNHLQTFDASDPSNVVPLDGTTFGANEDLFATLFLGNRAFCVTYRRVDPLHAFEISDEGLITPGSEFVVSGWNEFFRAVVDDSRLIGIGIDDQAGNTLAVSLYDVSDVSNPEPLLARERVAADTSWSEASWDHRAFSVLEEAVAVQGPGGVVETGLVLLPFTGLDAARSEYTSAVQIFTFSDHTLTRRGLMRHGTPVRRSFEAAAALVANLSETELSLFATEDPEQPAELGRLELAPDYTDVFRFGDYQVRVVNGSSEPGVWSVGSQAPSAAIEVVGGDADPDLAEPVARLALPSQAALHRTGPFLVSVTFGKAAWTSHGAPESKIAVYDLRDPAHPRLAGQLRSDRVQPAYLWPQVFPPCFDCAVALLDARPILALPPLAGQHVVAVPGGLAFLQGHPDRGWTLDVLDLSDPSTPRFAEGVALGDDAEGVRLLAAGSEAWIALKRPTGADLQGRAQVRYFVVRVDVSDPSLPTPGEPINVPGELVAVDGDTIFTRDFQWNGEVLETAVVRVAVGRRVGRVEAVRWFEERSVEKVLLDGAGHVLVSHRPHWSPEEQQPTQVLTVLDARSDDLEVLSESVVGSWASLLDAIPGRALFQISAGLLVFDLDDASAPRARALFAMRGWPHRILIDGRRVLAPSGRYGILRFDLDASNLPPQASVL